MKNIRILSLYFLACLLFANCESPEKVKEIDSSLEKKGQVDGKNLGVNEDGEAILQKETDADDELLLQQRLNLELEDDLKHERKLLDHCAVDMADPRLGGDGEFPGMEQPDAKASPAEIREQFGLDASGNLKVVQSESFTKKLAAERKYENRLHSLIEATANHRKKCEMRMKTARVKMGLPAERYKAEGYYEKNGSWVETRKAELTIDDAFQIKQMESGKGKDKASE